MLNHVSHVHVVCVIPLLTCWLKLFSKFITSGGGCVVCIFCRAGEFVQRIVAVQPQQSGIRALVCLCKLLSFLW